MKSRLPFARKRGSILMLVLILSTALTVVIASALRVASTETRLSERHMTLINARNATESVLDYGVAQLALRIKSQKNLAPNELVAKPLSLTIELKDFLTQMDAEVEVELVGGEVPPYYNSFFIDPEDPVNQDDPHKGKTIDVKHIEVYAKATMPGPSGDFTAYAMQTLQVRKAPFVSHAIFYNMDLEFHPGPPMKILGPVHSNYDIYALAVDKLEFEGVVTMAGDFYNAMKSSEYWKEIDNELVPYWKANNEKGQKANNVFIKDAAGKQHHFYDGSGELNDGRNYYNSWTPKEKFIGSIPGVEGVDDFGSFADNLFDGNLQTREHSIPVMQPVGFSPYIADEDASDGIDPLQNHAYALTEPAITKDDPTTKDWTMFYKDQREQEKLAYLATLTIKTWEEDPFLSSHEDLDGDGKIDAEFDTDGDGLHDDFLRDYPMPILVDRHRTWDRDDNGTIEPDEYVLIPENAIRLRRRPDVEDGWSAASHEQFVDAALNSGTVSDPEARKVDPHLYNSRFHISFQRIIRPEGQPLGDPILGEEQSFVMHNSIGQDEEALARFIQYEDLYPRAWYDNGTQVRFDRDGTAHLGGMADLAGNIEAGYTNSIERQALEMRALFDQIFAAHPYVEEDPDVHQSDIFQNNSDALTHRQIPEEDNTTGLFPAYLMADGRLQEEDGDYLYEIYFGDLNENGRIDPVRKPDGTFNEAGRQSTDGGEIPESIFGDLNNDGDTSDTFAMTNHQLNETAADADFNRDGDKNDTIALRNFKLFESVTGYDLNLDGHNNSHSQALGDLNLSEAYFGDLNGDGEMTSFFNRMDASDDGDSSDLISGVNDERVRRHDTSEHEATHKAGIDLIEFNLTALHYAFEELGAVNDVLYNGNFLETRNYATGEAELYDASESFSGNVFVELPFDVEAMTARSTFGSETYRPDYITKAIENRGVLLRNAGGTNHDAPPGMEQQRVPDPSYNRIWIDGEGDEPGKWAGETNRIRNFTLTTNGPIYVQGHFNSDGLQDTGNDGGPDVVGDPEAVTDVPAAIISDAITFLSPNWSFQLSKSDSKRDRKTEFGEYAFAVFSGVFPTMKDGDPNNKSGGSHNFPRFLESWRKTTFRVRGSLIAMYESEVQSQRWSTEYYDPPRREYAFPGEMTLNLPQVPTFRNVEFRFLTEDEYDAKLAALAALTSDPADATE